MKLLMITGDRLLAQGKKGAFYNTLSEFHKYWERIDIITPPIFVFFKLKTYNLKPITDFSNVFIHPSPWPLILQPLWILREGLRILKTNNYSLKSENYLMTVHEYPPFYNGIGARMLWNRVKMPYVLEIHHIPGFPRALSLKEKLYVNFSKIFLEYDSDKASLVRVVNKKQTPAFLKQYGVPESKIKCVPSLYVDLDIFKPLNIKKEFDAIFVGRLVENKGIDLLLKAIEFSISNFQFPIKCLIVGDGPLMKSLKFKVKSLGLEDNFIFWGWARDQQEIAKLLNQSRILVMPSYSEGGPRVVAEAMACGVPVLATNVGLIPDLADKNAVKIIDWDARDIAKKAEELLENESEMNRLARIGIEIAKRFEKKETIKNYTDKLKEVFG